MLGEVMALCAKGALIALTGSGARTALQNAYAAAAASPSIAAPTALTTYATITTDNSYTEGFDHAIQTNLAIVIAAIYKRPVPQSLIDEAAAAYAAVMPALPA